MDGWVFDVDPRFDVQVRKVGPVFYSVQVTDTLTGRHVPVSGGSLLTGRSSVRRAVHFSTARYLGVSTPVLRLGSPPPVSGASGSGAPRRAVATPPVVWSAVVLIRLYALGLVALAAVLLFRAVTDSGFVADRQLDPRALGGVLAFSVLLLGAGALLTAGARSTRAGGAITLVAGPLLAVVGIGLVGETVDSLGTATLASDVVGGLVILAAATPLVLLATPPARRFRAGAVSGVG